MTQFDIETIINEVHEVYNLSPKYTNFEQKFPQSITEFFIIFELYSNSWLYELAYETFNDITLLLSDKNDINKFEQDLLMYFYSPYLTRNIGIFKEWRNFILSYFQFYEDNENKIKQLYNNIFPIFHAIYSYYKIFLRIRDLTNQYPENLVLDLYKAIDKILSLNGTEQFDIYHGYYSKIVICLFNELHYQVTTLIEYNLAEKYLYYLTEFNKIKKCDFFNTATISFTSSWYKHHKNYSKSMKSLLSAYEDNTINLIEYSEVFLNSFIGVYDKLFTLFWNSGDQNSLEELVTNIEENLDSKYISIIGKMRLDYILFRYYWTHSNKETTTYYINSYIKNIVHQSPIFAIRDLYTIVVFYFNFNLVELASNTLNLLIAEVVRILNEIDNELLRKYLYFYQDLAILYHDSELFFREKEVLNIDLLINLRDKFDKFFSEHSIKSFSNSRFVIFTLFQNSKLLLKFYKLTNDIKYINKLHSRINLVKSEEITTLPKYAELYMAMNEIITYYYTGSYERALDLINKVKNQGYQNIYPKLYNNFLEIQDEVMEKMNIMINEGKSMMDILDEKSFNSITTFLNKIQSSVIGSELDS